MTLSLLAACGLPTEVPKVPLVDVRWVVPSQSTRIAVSNLLPGGIAVSADSSAFLVSVAGATVTRALSQDCGTCVAANGLVAPKPGFIASASLSTALPADVASATISGTTLQFNAIHNYTFDPLRPSASPAAPRGYAIITVSNGTSVLGRDSVDGATTPFAPNVLLSRPIPLSGSISSSSPVTVSVTLNSPAGDPVLIDASRTITASVTPTNIRVPTASVVVTNRQVSSSTTLNLADVDSTIIAKVQRGALLLTIVNPFAVTGSLTVKLTPQGGATITKVVPLALNSTTATITLEGPELRSLLGHTVTVSYSGSVSATGPVNVSPRQAVVVTSRLDVELQVGG